MCVCVIVDFVCVSFFVFIDYTVIRRFKVGQQDQLGGSAHDHSSCIDTTVQTVWMTICDSMISRNLQEFVVRSISIYGKMS